MLNSQRLFIKEFVKVEGSIIDDIKKEGIIRDALLALII
jgi:hypothetical protein